MAFPPTGLPVGANSTPIPCGKWVSANYDNSGTEAGNSQVAECDVPPFVGSMTFNAIEGQRAGTEGFWGETNMLLTTDVRY